MARTAGIGYQDFEQLIVEDNFYVDKTMFIKESSVRHIFFRFHHTMIWDKLSLFCFQNL